MADLADIQGTFDNRLFAVACHDAARIVSLLSLEAEDFRKPRRLNSLKTNLYEKCVYLYRWFYLVFFKGFTPVVFDILPYTAWYIITIAVYIIRLVVLPIILRLNGFGKHASWVEPKLGSQQPQRGDPEDEPYKVRSLSEEHRLAVTDFGDSEYEAMITALYKKTCHLSPHSRSPGYPFAPGFPGNFMDHLTGVFKILVAWGQPQYIARAGLFHSVYGTYDYRNGVYDLRSGRQELSDTIGPAAEELAFIICTSDRLGMMKKLLVSMYGENAKHFLGGGITKEGDGNPYGPLVGKMSSEGYPVGNHITQTTHVFPPDLFAQFIVIFCADFMDQGALALGSDDADICIFQFLRYRFFNDVLQFVKPYLHVMPPVFEKYMGDKEYVELTRDEVIDLKRIWFDNVGAVLEAACAEPQLTPEASTKEEQVKEALFASKVKSIVNLSEADKAKLARMIQRCPYLAEPCVALSCALANDETFQGHTRKSLATKALTLTEEWGMMAMKRKANMKSILRLVRILRK